VHKTRCNTLRHSTVFAAATAVCARFRLPARSRRGQLGSLRPAHRRAFRGLHQCRCLTTRSTGLATAWHQARAAPLVIIRRTGLAPRLRSPVSLNVRHRDNRACTHQHGSRLSARHGQCTKQVANTFATPPSLQLPQQSALAFGSPPAPGAARSAPFGLSIGAPSAGCINAAA
jgi:hypothetical protein